MEIRIALITEALITSLTLKFIGKLPVMMSINLFYMLYNLVFTGSLYQIHVTGTTLIKNQISTRFLKPNGKIKFYYLLLALY